MAERMVCLDDFERRAAEVLSKGALGYFRSGADDMVTVMDNKEAFKRWKILPRVLRDVSCRDLSTRVLGHPIAFPVCLAPSAFHAEAHGEGEIATARGAKAAQTIYTMSTFSSKSIEDVSRSCPEGVHFFQLYVFKDRSITHRLIKRAEDAGYKALVVTVDVPFTGKRREDLRNSFKLHPMNKPANFMDKKYEDENVHKRAAALLDDTLNWEDIKQLKNFTKLPIILKGILSAEDAKIAVEVGADAIMVSNHGGRQLDTVPATIDVLPEIVDAVQTKCEVYLDGGVRLGTDVFKALALGARAVFIGRPVVYGLACNGSQGLEEVLGILRSEFDAAMALAGCTSVSEINQSYVRHQSSFGARL